MDSHIVGDHHNGVMLLCLDILEKLNHTPLDHNIRVEGSSADQRGFRMVARADPLAHPPES